jgi:ribosomal protein S27AE
MAQHKPKPEPRVSRGEKVKTRHGRCATCGRVAVVILKVGSLREAEGACPFCGADPFLADITDAQG